MTERQVTKLSSKEDENRRQLLELGVSESDATRALSAVSGRGLQAALEYLFGSADAGARARNKSKPKDHPVKELKPTPSKAPKTPERNEKKSKGPESVQKASKSKESVPSKSKSPKLSIPKQSSPPPHCSAPEPPGKPQTARVLYIISCKDKVAAENPTASFAEMASILDKQWKSLTAAERRHWEQVEKEEKEKYDARFAKSEEESTASEVQAGSGAMPPKIAAAGRAETPKESKAGKSKRPSEGKSGPERKKAMLAAERR